MANPPPSLSLATLLEITESGAHPSNPFTDHHPPAQHQSRSSPRYRRCRLWWASACWETSYKVPLPDPDLLTWLPATRPSLPENVIPTPSQTLLVTHPWLDRPPGVRCNKDCPQLLALLRAPSSLI